MFLGGVPWDITEGELSLVAVPLEVKVGCVLPEAAGWGAVCPEAPGTLGAGLALGTSAHLHCPGCLLQLDWLTPSVFLAL